MIPAGWQNDDVANTAVSDAFRAERAIVLASLIAYVGDFQLAEDAVQDAFADALAAWPRDGIPANRRAWLALAARRRAIDRVRRRRSQADRGRLLATLLQREQQEHSTVTDTPRSQMSGCVCCSPAAIQHLIPRRASHSRCVPLAG
jgi:RNA polymerase sigma-70 factor (ECF subfamily)